MCAGSDQSSCRTGLGMPDPPPADANAHVVESMSKADVVGGHVVVYDLS